MATHPSILSGKSHGQRILVGYSPWDCKRVEHNLVTTHTHTHSCGIFVPRPGIKPISLALEDRFLNTGPPGKSPGTSS